MALCEKAERILGHALPYGELIEQMLLIVQGYGANPANQLTVAHEKSPTCCQTGPLMRVFAHFT